MTDDERWRCFVALPIANDARTALAAAIASWRQRRDLEGLRWTDPEGWHLTLAFLGSIPADEIAGIGAAIREVAMRHGRLPLVGAGLGAFPSAGRARVAWCGIVDTDGRVERLAQDVRDALGLDAADRFHAHITIARARREPVDLRQFLAVESGPSMDSRTDRVELMRSHLGRGPAHYELIESAVLGAAAHV